RPLVARRPARARVDVHLVLAFGDEVAERLVVTGSRERTSTGRRLPAVFLALRRGAIVGPAETTVDLGIQTGIVLRDIECKTRIELDADRPPLRLIHDDWVSIMHPLLVLLFHELQHRKEAIADVPDILHALTPHLSGPDRKSVV